jgi:DNA replication protein
MRSTDDRNSAALAAEAVMLEGSVSVPALLLKYYRTLRLSDGEAMLLIHLIAFREKEGTPFPTLEDIQRRRRMT